LEGGHHDGFKAAPRAASMDHLGLVEAVDGLGQGIVMGISDTAHGRFDPRFGEAFCVVDGDTLGSLVAVNWRPREAGCPS
jgi:hypothetical protein